MNPPVTTPPVAPALPDLRHSLMERSPVPMAELEGAGHVMRYVNPAFCRLVGKSRAALLGTPFADTVQAGDSCLALVERVYRTGEAEIHTEAEAAHPKPHPASWSYALWPVLDAEHQPIGVMVQVTETTEFHQQTVAMNEALVRSSVRQHEFTEAAEQLNAQLQAEITERKAVEEALRKSEAQYRSVITVMEEGIVVHNADGDIVACNPSAERILGRPASQLLSTHDSRPAWHTVHADGSPFPVETHPIAVTLQTGQPQSHIVMGVYRPDGALVWIAINTQPLTPPGQTAPSAVVVSFSDITARKHVDEELRRLHSELERRVEDRTRALQEAQAALQVLSRQVLNVQEAERRTLARELHDEMGQVLMALRLSLRAAQRAPQQQAERLEESLGIVDRLVAQVRQLSLDLRPLLLDDLGLVATLRWYVDRQTQQAGLVIHFNTQGLEARLDPMLETTCFRVTQEALTNVLRHAQATQVWIDVCQQHNQLCLAIRDDGKGFDVPAMRERSRQGQSFGILGMEERVQLAGGHICLTSAPAQGTEVRAHFPLTPVAEGGGRKS